jgi:hypothetical protein
MLEHHKHSIFDVNEQRVYTPLKKMLVEYLSYNQTHTLFLVL